MCKAGMCTGAKATAASPRQRDRARGPKMGKWDCIVEAGPREPRRTGMAAGPLNSTGVATFARQVHAFAGRMEVSP